MMNDDILVLYYYGDGLDDRERRRIAAALEADESLAARYADLCRDLELLAPGDSPEVPAHVMQRMHDTIDRIARPVLVRADPRPRSFSLPSFAWGAAVTAALAIGIGIGVFLSGEPVVPDTPDRGAFARGMQVYLQDARQGLVAMPVSTSEDRTRLIMHIVEQNRLFESAAVQNDAPGLARVLRAFEPILMKLAAEDITPAEAEALRAQLAFELNVMLTKISRVSSNETQTT